MTITPNTPQPITPETTDGEKEIVLPTGVEKKPTLSIKRVFTTPGIHPYDQIEWEKRDVLQQNWKTGETVFEQKNVEFPKNWSLNASTIVTTKYFRGAMGSSERESSLRQLIDRVVGPYISAAKDYGYVTKTEDLLILEHELKYMLVNQIFSFNSPVWFNVGTTSPQQVSACQPYHALVNTVEGLVPIGKLVDENRVGTKVINADGSLAQILAVKNNGKKEVFRIETYAGYSIEATADHLIWKHSGQGSGRFVPVSDLSVDDSLIWKREDVPVEVFNFANLSSEAKESALAGWLMTDGFVGQYTTGKNRSLTVEPHTINDEEYSWVKPLISDIWGDHHSHERKQDTVDPKVDFRRIRLYGEELRPFVEKWNLLDRGIHMKHPEYLNTAKLEVVAAYLRSVYQADGYINLRPENNTALIGISMESESVIRGIQLLLQRLGIFSRVKDAEDKRDNRHHRWMLNIQTLGDRIRFAEMVGFIGKDKQEKLIESLSYDGKQNKSTKVLSIKNISSVGVQNVYDIQTDTEEYLSNGIRVHNCFILAVDDTMDSILNWYREEGLIFKGGSGAGLNLSKIRSSKELLRSSGGTASGPVSFMRGADASAGTIKSGGACLAPWTLVYTAEQGPITVKELAEKGEDFISLSYNPILGRYQACQARAWESGRKQLMRLTTDKGVFTLSKDHPVLLMDGQYVALENLKPGMSIRPGTITQNDLGYLRIGLHDGKKSKESIHRLVAQDILGKEINNMEVHHKDRNPQNNHPENLEVVDRAEHLLIHAYEDFANGVHPFQQYHGKGNHPEVAGEKNGMSHASGNRTPEYKAKRDAGMRRTGVYELGAAAAQHQKMLNTAYTIVNNGGSIDTFEDYVAGRKKYVGRIASITKLEKQIKDRFGNFDNFVEEVRTNNHKVVSTELLHDSIVYDVEVDNDTPRDKSPQDGHNFLILSEASEKDDRKGYTGIIISNTRRAAKMVVLDVDHPDIEQFIDTKMKEEEKIRVLRDAGFDMDLGGEDIVSVQYQNANNSVRVSDEFMKAVETDGSFGLKARVDGEVIETVGAKKLFRKMAEAAWSCADPGIQYDDTINHWHTNPETGKITASNPCSEYLSLDNSSCNLASLNLLKFYDRETKTFDVEKFIKAVEFVITAMEISISFADFPTEAIGRTTRDFRQLGIGFANLGALLMASGLAYDSKEGRALSAAITSLMTATSYRRSAEIAAVVGPYAGFQENRKAHTRVMQQHMTMAMSLLDAVRGNESDNFVTPNLVNKYDPAVELAEEAVNEWLAGITLGQEAGWRNAQASVLAPTGCLTSDTLVNTSEGLLKLEELGDVYGSRWQDINGVSVSTPDGAQSATKFFVNGEEETIRVEGIYGSSLTGTLKHQIKVVNQNHVDPVWKHMMDVSSEDWLVSPRNTIVGKPRQMVLPVSEEPHIASMGRLQVPETMSPELAELVGYFMGDGSAHAKNLRFSVDIQDADVVEHLQKTIKTLFGLDTTTEKDPRGKYVSVVVNSTSLVRWWEAAGFSKVKPREDHSGKGYHPHIPLLVRASNDPHIWSAFLRGLFEADGTISLLRESKGNPTLASANKNFVNEVSIILRTLGYATTIYSSGAFENRYSDKPSWRVRLRNNTYTRAWIEDIGFISHRKQEICDGGQVSMTGRKDLVVVDAKHVEKLAKAFDSTVADRITQAISRSLAKYGVAAVARDVLVGLQEKAEDAVLGEWLNYWYEPVSDVALAGVQPTYDISVPANVTYIANNVVSHNTIGFMLDCDTTGVEPDFSLLKFKKMVGGGSLEIVNQRVDDALYALEYPQETIEAIKEFVKENGNVVGAPGLREEHYDVFDCAIGERAISPRGHILMMAAVQPFISGAISKTINIPESATVEDIEKVYFDGWKLGLKALAVYRDNCKVGQPLSSSRDKAEDNGSITSTEPEIIERIVEKIIERPVRRRLPKTRNASTTSFIVGGAEGYLTTGKYSDDTIGEVFVKMSKQGSTLAGIMDAFSIAVSLGLQYGVPLEAFVAKFTNMRFEPSGMTDDPDIRMAQSLLDYMFRKIALNHLDYETRSAYGIYTTQERADALNGAPAVIVEENDSEPDQAAIAEEPKTDPVVEEAHLKHIRKSFSLSAEGPLCNICGVAMVRTGACNACPSCGQTSGCS